jgi:hypothetical protein
VTEIRITVNQPHWDDEDFDYLMEKLGAVLGSEIPSGEYDIEEVDQ